MTLATSELGTELEFAGDCEVPDPAGPDPCRLSFTVEFERSPSRTQAEVEVSWLMDLSTHLSIAEPDTELGWPTEITPL